MIKREKIKMPNGPPVDVGTTIVEFGFGDILVDIPKKYGDEVMLEIRNIPAAFPGANMQGVEFPESDENIIFRAKGNNGVIGLQTFMYGLFCACCFIEKYRTEDHPQQKISKYWESFINCIDEVEDNA